MQLLVPFQWAIGKLRLEGRGSIDEEANRRDGIDGDSILGASSNGLGFSYGCVTTGICTLQE